MRALPQPRSPEQQGAVARRRLSSSTPPDMQPAGFAACGNVRAPRHRALAGRAVVAEPFLSPDAAPPPGTDCASSFVTGCPSALVERVGAVPARDERAPPRCLACRVLRSKFNWRMRCAPARSGSGRIVARKLRKAGAAGQRERSSRPAERAPAMPSAEYPFGRLSLTIVRNRPGALTIFTPNESGPTISSSPLRLSRRESNA